MSRKIKTKRSAAAVPVEYIKEAKEEREPKVSGVSLEKTIIPISNNTSWIFFGITLFFITMAITLLYNIVGQVGTLSDQVAANQLRTEQHINVVNTGLRAEVESQSSFCYGYDQVGQKGYAIDPRKAPACPEINVTQ